jgi:hypothetical protein
MEAKTSILQREFPIVIGGKDFTICFPMPAVWAFEDISGVKMAELNNVGEPGVELSKEDRAKLVDENLFGKTPRERMERTLMLLWAGIKTKHPGVTYEQLTEMVYIPDLQVIAETVMQAFSASMAQPGVATEGEDEERPTAAVTPAAS